MDFGNVSAWNTYEKLPCGKFNSLYYMIMKMAKQIISKEYIMSFTARVKLLYDYTYIIGYTDITIKEHKKIHKMTKNDNALTRCIHEFIRNKKWNHLLENS